MKKSTEIMHKLKDIDSLNDVDAFEEWWEDSRPFEFTEHQKPLVRIVWDAAVKLKY